MHSIRSKIMAVTIAAILTSILALGGIGLLGLRRDSDQTALEKMNLISENMQLRLDAYFNSIQQSVDMGTRIAKDSLGSLDYMLFSTALSPEDQERLDEEMRAHCAEVEHALSSIASNTSGIITYYYCVNAELGSTEHGFFWSRRGQTDFTAQPDLVSTDLDINDTDHTSWYYAPLKAGRPVWVGPYHAHYMEEDLTLSYVSPIYYAGFLVGVLGMDIPYETITAQVDSFRVYDTGYVFLMDRDGDILYHPSLPVGYSLDDLDQNIDPEVLKHSSNGDELIRYTLNGQEKQLAFSTLQNKIKIAVTVPVSEISASQRKMSMTILLVAIAILAVFSVVTLLLVRALTRPLLNLAAASEELVSGNYDVQLDYHGKDEVGTLTRSFRQMRDHLKFYINDLNSKAYTDAMTGIRNKGAFALMQSRLDSEIHMGDPKPTFGFVVFDCNDLKQINDQYGHSCGDTYLKAACRLICRIFSHSPVFRIGGDEFCVILQKEDYTKRDQLLGMLDRMTTANNHSVANPWEKVNLSRGMAVYRPGTDRNTEEVLNRADEKMYEDKKRYHDSDEKETKER